MPSSPSPGGRPSCSQLWEPSCGLCVPYAPSLSARMSESCVRRVGERRSYTGYNLMLTTTRRRHMPRWSLTGAAAPLQKEGYKKKIRKKKRSAAAAHHFDATAAVSTVKATWE